jgi:glutamyl-tRNA synthetase
MKPRVRFAPSPTGYLHIGGARTALFNWLFARHTGGTFILRIEDTDEVRSTPESVEAILEGMTWLGLDWDEGPVAAADPVAAKGDHGPYFQMQRLSLYREAVDRLVAEGKAYPCYCTPAEVDKMRERAQLLKRPPKYDGACRALSEAQRRSRAGEGRTHSLRFKSPIEGVTAFDDLVHGSLRFENALLEDFVIVKTSGVPTYNFACVVDDHAMGITHVIRGDDHLSNTPRQILAYQALGWTPPAFAHLSMILGPDGSRLSKRNGVTSIQEYKTMGFLAETLRNYLALLGWATEDSQQLFTREELKNKFTLERCGKSPAIFDYNKLLWMNGEYLRKLPVGDIIAHVRERNGTTKELHPFFWDADRRTLEAAVELEHEKFKLLTDVPRLIDFIFKDVEFDPASVEKVLKKPEAPRVLEAAETAFRALGGFTAASTETACRSVAAALGLKNAGVFHPVRVATSGRTQGPSLFHYLEILGKEAVIKRLNTARNMLLH